MSVDIEQLSKVLEHEVDTSLSRDEVRRYVLGAMDAQERAEIEEFIEVSPKARRAVERARRWIVLTRWPQIPAIALAAGVAIVAFFLWRPAGGSGARPAGLVAQRWDAQTTEDRVREALRAPGSQRGPERPEPATLESPAPEARGSVDPPERLVLRLSKPARPGDFDVEVWTMERDAPRWRVPSTQSLEGARMVVVPGARLAPGGYAVGVRLSDGSLATEEERPWRLYRFRVLTPEEGRLREAALRRPASDPMGAAMQLFDLDRLGESASVLAGFAAQDSRTKAVLAGIARWTEDARSGFERTLPEPLKDLPAGGGVRTTALETPEADSAEALDKLVERALDPRILDPEARRDSFLRASAMARRLKVTETTAKAGFSLILKIAMEEGRIGDVEPYIGPTVEDARRAIAALAPKGAKDDLAEAYMGACYFGAELYLRTQRYPQALDLARRGNVYARSRPMGAPLARLNYMESAASLALVRLEDALAGWLAERKILARLRESQPKAYADLHGPTEGYLADCLYQLGRHDEAIRTCTRTMGQKGVGPEVEAALLKTRASAYIERGDDKLADRDLKLAWRKLGEGADPIALAEVEIAFGMLHLNRGRLHEARTYLGRARLRAQGAGRPDVERTAVLNLRGVAVLSGDPLEAERFPPSRLPKEALKERLLDADVQARDLIEQGRWAEAEAVAQEELRLSRTRELGAYRVPALGNLAWAMARRGDLKGALDSFFEARQAYEPLLKASEPERVGIVQQRNSTGLYARYAWTLCRDGQVDQAQAVLNSGRAIGLRARRGDPPREEGETIRRTIADRPGTLFLQYAPLDRNRSLLLISAKGEKRAWTVWDEIPTGTDGLAKGMEAWLPDREPGRRPEDNAVEERAAAELGRRLLEPLERRALLNPARFKRIVVVGDGPIQRIPFAALVDGQGRRLIRRFAIVNAVALGLDRPPTPPFADRPLCAVAHPGRDGAKFAPGTLQEARDVARVFPGSRLLVEGAAREATLKREMPRYRMLHLACHGATGVVDPLDARLMLAPGGGDDGDLSAREVSRLHLTAELAVLSGCETATGELAGGDGLLGLAWAFQAAGCRSVLGTAWRVDDAASHDLVVAFSKGIARGMDKAESLRAATLELIDKNPSHSHPYYWAGFKLIGDPSPVRL